MKLPTSFVDLLFILLCGTIVLLSRSIYLAGLEPEPAEVGAGGVSEIRAADVRIVAVSEAGLQFEGSDATFDQVTRQLASSDVVVVVSADDRVSHHRMMAVWSDFAAAGRDVQLGVRPKSKQPGS